MSETENLEIKKRARRRLVGAVALALLAAILLPMIMEQDPRHTSGDIQITIPDRDADASQSRPIATPSDDAVTSPLAPSPDEQAPSSAQATPEPATAATVAPPHEPTRPDKAEARAEAAEKTSRADAPKADSARAAARDAEAARARAILEGKEVPRGDSFVLQIGAFSDAAKAARISADLKKQGFEAFTEKAGDVTRVRIGPVVGRTAADKTAAQLKALGFSTVVTPR